MRVGLTSAALAFVGFVGFACSDPVEMVSPEVANAARSFVANCSVRSPCTMFDTAHSNAHYLYMVDSGSIKLNREGGLSWEFKGSLTRWNISPPGSAMPLGQWTWSSGGTYVIKGDSVRVHLSTGHSSFAGRTDVVFVSLTPIPAQVPADWTGPETLRIVPFPGGQAVHFR
jgi:hypothetical protein